MDISPGGGGTNSAGFTIVELLITVVVIGVLAAIAIPSLARQRHKANDANAQHLAAIAAQAMQEYATEHDSYAASRTDVLANVPELNEAPSWTLRASASDFAISVTSTSDHIFTIERSTGGAARRTCDTGPDPAGSGACPRTGVW